MERGRAKSRYYSAPGDPRAPLPPTPPPLSLSLSSASVGTRLCERLIFNCWGILLSYDHFYYRHVVYQIWLVSCCLHRTGHCCFNWVSFQHYARRFWKGLVKSLAQNCLDLFMYLSIDPSLYIPEKKGTKNKYFRWENSVICMGECPPRLSMCAVTGLVFGKRLFIQRTLHLFRYNVSALFLRI